MGGCCEAEFEAEESKIPRLPLFNPPPMHSPERSGMVTPPLHTSASVPFGWEEEPGKPRPCTALATFSSSSSSHQTPNNKCLELPPRLLLTDANLTKLPSPTTVLDGPYTRSEDCYGSSFSAERGQLGTMVLSKGKGFGFWRKKDFRVKHVFPSSADNKDDTNHNISAIIGSHHKNVRMRKMKHHGSFANPFHAKSGAWVSLFFFFNFSTHSLCSVFLNG